MYVHYSMHIIRTCHWAHSPPWPYKTWALAHPSNNAPGETPRRDLCRSQSPSRVQHHSPFCDDDSQADAIAQVISRWTQCAFLYLLRLTTVGRFFSSLAYISYWLDAAGRDTPSCFSCPVQSVRTQAVFWFGVYIVLRSSPSRHQAQLNVVALVCLFVQR